MPILLNKKPDFKFFLNNIYLYYINFIPVKSPGYNNNDYVYYNDPKYIYIITNYRIKKLEFIAVFNNVFWLGFTANITK